MAFFIWQLVQLFFTNFNWNYDLLQGSIDIIISQNLGIAKKNFDFIFTVIISVIFYKLAGQLLENNDGIILMIFLRFFILIFDIIGIFAVDFISKLFSLVFGIVYIFILVSIPLKIANRSYEDKTLESSASKLGMGLLAASGVPQILILVLLFVPLLINFSYEIILLMGILGWFFNILGIGLIYMGTIDYSSNFYNNLELKNSGGEK